jgi:hypothetical protein
MEINPKTNDIGYCNMEGNRLLQSFYKHANPSINMPKILEKNEFFKA